MGQPHGAMQETHSSGDVASHARLPAQSMWRTAKHRQPDGMPTRRPPPPPPAHACGSHATGLGAAPAEGTAPVGAAPARGGSGRAEQNAHGLRHQQELASLHIACGHKAPTAACATSVVQSRWVGGWVPGRGVAQASLAQKTAEFVTGLWAAGATLMYSMWALIPGRGRESHAHGRPDQPRNQDCAGKRSNGRQKCRVRALHMHGACVQQGGPEREQGLHHP